MRGPILSVALGAVLALVSTAPAAAQATACADTAGRSHGGPPA